jgi:uncharacterized protein YgiM (DUF1202 family)
VAARWFSWLGIALVLLACPAQANTERRVALIIGNDAYKGLKRLDNGVNDARAMERELKSIGFETLLKVNANRKEMHGAISEFGNKLAAGSVGLFYYAGHGIQSGDKNFLVPVDAVLESEDDLVVDAIDVGRVMHAMEAARNKLNIVVLDACRDNPLPKGGRSGSRGLAVVQAPTGTFVAYATGPGKIAQDGDRGGNGVYTGELVKALREPGLKIEDVFKRAGNGVMEKTGGKQVPWTQASVQGDFYFRPPVAGVMTPSTGGAGVDKETVFWQSIQNSKQASDYEAYLITFPNGTFVGLAKRRIDGLKGTQVASASPAAVPRPDPPARAEPAVLPTTPPVPPKPQPVIESMSRDMVAGRKATLRDAPDATSKAVATLAEGDAVKVTGKVQGSNWYAVDRKGSTAFVVLDNLEDSAAYKARKGRETVAAQPAALSVPSSDGLGTVLEVIPEMRGMVFNLRKGQFVSLNDTVLVTASGSQRRFRIMSKDGTRVTTVALDGVLPSVGANVLSSD